MLASSCTYIHEQCGQLVMSGGHVILITDYCAGNFTVKYTKIGYKGVCKYCIFGCSFFIQINSIMFKFTQIIIQAFPLIR